MSQDQPAAEPQVDQPGEAPTGGIADVDVSDDGMSITSTDKDGTYTWQGGSQAELPEGFPEDVYVYEGSVVEMASSAPTSYTIALATKDPFAKVVESYKEKMASAGWSLRTSTQMPGTEMLSYLLGDRAVSVSIFDEDGQTKIGLSVAR